MVIFHCYVSSPEGNFYDDFLHVYSRFLGSETFEQSNSEDSSNHLSNPINPYKSPINPLESTYKSCRDTNWISPGWSGSRTSLRRCRSDGCCFNSEEAFGSSAVHIFGVRHGQSTHLSMTSTWVNFSKPPPPWGVWVPPSRKPWSWIIITGHMGHVYAVAPWFAMIFPSILSWEVWPIHKWLLSGLVQKTQRSSVKLGMIIRGRLEQKEHLKQKIW